MTKCYKPALWDKMQNCFTDYNDHMIHFVIKFNGMLDEDALSKAIEKAFIAYPILRCKFVEGILHSRWEEINYDNPLSVIEDDDEEIIQEFLCRPIDEYNEIQVRFMVLRKDKKDTLCILLNHMVCDGNSCKQLLVTLAEAYSAIVSGEDYPVENKMGNRDYEAVYDALSLGDDIKANTRLNYGSKEVKREGFKFVEEPVPDTGRILIDKLKANDFLKLKQYCKDNGFTINDVIMASFIKSMQAVSEIDAPIDLDCIVDLRRYLKDKKAIGFTNCVSTTQVNVGNVKDYDLREITFLVHEIMEKRKNDLPGLSGLSLLRINFGLFPQNLSRYIIKKNYFNPLVAVSNIGIVSEECVNFKGLETVDMFITGSIKKKPYIQLALTTFRNEVTFSIALYGYQEDFDRAQRTLDYQIKELENLIK